MRDATSFRDREVIRPQHSSWLHEWWLRECANTLIGGDIPLWPMDWLQRWLGGRTFERASDGSSITLVQRHSAS